MAIFTLENNTITSNNINDGSITTPVDTIILPEHNSNQIRMVRHCRRSIIREFALNASTHALPGIARSESIHNRIFWTIAFIASSGIMIHFIVTAILNYFSYPTNMDVSYDDTRQQYFSAFTFCNLAAFRFDRFIGPFVNYTNSMYWTNTKDTTTISAYQAQFIQNFMIDKMSKNESIEEYCFSLSSMLVGCSYNFNLCSTTDFISFISPTHGLCYTFTAKIQDNTTSTLHYGDFYGDSGVFILGLYVHSHQYVPYTIDGKLFIDLNQ